MPLHPDYQKILKAFQMRYGEEEGEHLFWAWVNRLGLQPEKPYRQREAFSWAEPRLQALEGREGVYRVEALFPLESMNRVIYTEEELLRAARTLIGKPVNLNHKKPLKGVEILDAEYEDGAVECLLQVENPEIKRMIDRGEILHVSIEADYREAEVVNGLVPRGLAFTGLALLTRDTLPGVPLTRIMPLEGLIEAFEKEVRTDLSQKIEVEEQGQRTCYLCGRPLSDRATIGRYELHPQCAARFWELASSIFHFTEATVASHETPKAPEEYRWDADAAEQRIRRWASTDGSGEKEKIDWAKYRQAYAWYNSEDPENFGSYKLPHHDIVDGELRVVWRGVAAAMAALMGARGGVDIPPADRRSVFHHLARHYTQFGREPPEFESYLEFENLQLRGNIEEQKKAIQKLVEEKMELEGKLKKAKRYSRIIVHI